MAPGDVWGNGERFVLALQEVSLTPSSAPKPPRAPAEPGSCRGSGCVCATHGHDEGLAAAACPDGEAERGESESSN